MDEKNEPTRTEFDDVPEWAQRPHPGDILKREYEEQRMRPRDLALEKWGPTIQEWLDRDMASRTAFEGIVEREMSRRKRLEKPLPDSFLPKSPSMPRKKDGPERDMDR